MVIAIVFVVIIVLFLIGQSSLESSKTTVNETKRKLSNNYDKIIILNEFAVKNEVPYMAFNNRDRVVEINLVNKPVKQINYDDIVGIELIQDGTSTLSFGNIVGGSSMKISRRIIELERLYGIKNGGDRVSKLYNVESGLTQE